MEIKDINLELDVLERTLKRLKYNKNTNWEQYEEVKEKYEILKEQVFIMDSKLIISSEDMDIYEENGTKKDIKYYVMNKENNRMMAVIFINYSDYVPIYGNIGYMVYNDYQGKHISLKALELLTDTLIKRGMKTGVICIRPYNEASAKIAKAYGAKLIKKSPTTDGIDKYNIDLLEKQQQKIKNKKIK